MPTDEQLREQFEADVVASSPTGASLNFTQDGVGGYMSGFMHHRWLGWLAGLQARDAEVQALREALTEVTEDLASEVIARYGPIQTHPDTVRSFDRDMELVYRARKLLAGGETGETE